ncbi:MAG: hypothetical protein IPK56_08080 [Elusimicrobia bacterium]|nr:hypothetical protein [Elusimicrobiota bacterium]
MDFLSPEQTRRDGERVGPKARRLAEALARGAPVPAFIVLRPVDGPRTPWGPDGRDRLAVALEQLNAPAYAVRSCAVEEDGVTSQAGRFLTRLAVPPGDVPRAVEAVWAEARARGAEPGFTVILQRQVAADRAGVAFTRHPLGHPHLLIEWVAGPGAPLVGGTSAPREISFLRAAPPADSPLPTDALRWLVEAESWFGHPQDIEWAVEDGSFCFLQSRPITPLSTRRAEGLRRIEADLPRGPFLFEKTELTEAAPRPTPVTWEILKRLHAADGPIARVYRRIGVAYRDTGCLVSVGGELYVDRDREWAGLFPALTPLPGPGVRWKTWRGLGQTIGNGFRLAIFSPGDLAAAVDALRDALKAAPARDLAGALGRLLDDYETVFDVNLRASRALASAEKKLGRPLTAIEWKCAELPGGPCAPPDRVEGNSLEIADVSPFRPAAWRPTTAVARVHPVARTAAAWARCREVARWVVVRDVDALRGALRAAASAREWPDTDLAFFGTLSGDVPEAVCRVRREAHRAGEGFRGPPRLAPEVDKGSGPGRGVSPGVAKGVLVGPDDGEGLSDPIYWLEDLSIERAPLLDRARGLLVDRGGTLSHLAILARERGVPVVVDPAARRRLRAGVRVRLDGGAGRAEEVVPEAP